MDYVATFQVKNYCEKRRFLFTMTLKMWNENMRLSF